MPLSDITPEAMLMSLACAAPGGYDGIESMFQAPTEGRVDLSGLF